MSQGITPKKPIVILFERFVLDSIGTLSPDEEAQVSILVARVSGNKKRWQAWLKTELGLADGLEEQLASLWQQAQDLAKAKGLTVTPHEFAATVVEENFLDALEMLDAELAAKRSQSRY